MKRTMTIVGIGLMALVLVASFIRVGQKLASGSFASVVVSPTGGVAASLGVDGVQRVALSFGNFNYSPDTIRVKRGIPVEIAADLNRLRGCFSTFAIPELNVWKQFTPADAKVAFTPSRAGTFKFSCAMGMGAGRLIVEG